MKNARWKTRKGNPMIERRLKEIRARTEAATKGPWAIGRDPELGEVVVAGQLVVPRTRSDNLFVAYARKDVPWLLDLVERMNDLLLDLAGCETDPLRFNCEDGGWSCQFCDATQSREEGRLGPFPHEDDCPVTRARKLWREP